MTLYELKEQYQILNKFIEEEELDREAFKEALNQIEGSIEDKAENYVKAMKNYQAEADAIKTEEKRLYDKRKALENHAERIKSVLDETLRELNIKDLKAGIFNIKYQNNPPSVEVTDLDKIPDNYKLPQEIKIDKKAILQDIKSGQVVEGIEIKIGESMRIR